MKYKKRDRVKHPNMEEWGIGEVLEDSCNDFVRIFFTGVGEKELSLKHVQLINVFGKEAENIILDNLRVIPSSSRATFQSVSQSISKFCCRFPNGFYDDSFKDNERKYKLKANKLMLDLLNQNEFETLLHDNQYDEICKRALKVVNATNLIFPNEKMSLKDGLKMPAATNHFSECFYHFLYGIGELEIRFTNFSKVLEDINAAKWTIVSYFPFIMFPERYIFIKPTVTQLAANKSAFEINYSPKLNWLTYKSILTFSEFLKNELSELKPRDMIDIQTFLWCVAQD